MFKKALKIAASFGLLVGAYAGYTRLFAVITYQLGEAREDVGVASPEPNSTGALRAAELARESFPEGHWAAGKGLKLQYYDAIHGIYMYAQEKDISKDNKRIRVTPFAMIWISKDGKSRKTATSDVAIIDLSQPFVQLKASKEPSKIAHARLEGDVWLRDDKGTLQDPSDDLRVGPLTAVEFDDEKLQITSDSDVDLLDRDLKLTGIGLLIQLRRKLPARGAAPGAAGPSGFDAETIYVYKDVHIVVNNATTDGVLPGKAKPEKTGKTPIDVRSDREMRIDLPGPRREIVGPPHFDRPPDPTFVKFKTNVRVIRGTDKSDQLNCDTLDLTLMPDPKKPAAPVDPGQAEAEGGDGLIVVDAQSTPKAEGSKAEEGLLTELKIRVAHARGDAVWLQSEAQGMVARCVELIYEKHEFEGLPDITYLNGGFGKKLRVEKVDYDTKAAPATIKSVMVLTALDATIFDSGNGGTSKVIARGPGKTEERPARNASVSRTVWFEDEMEMLTWRDGQGPTPTPSPLAIRALNTTPPRPAGPPGTLRRLLTLSGVSKLVDHESATTLDARRSIVAEFQAEPNPAPSKGDGPAQIKWLDAYEDAHLTAPSKALTARQYLKAKFETIPAPPKLFVTAPVIGVGPGPIIAVAPPIEPEAKPDPAPAPVEPLVDGRAERVWATVLLGSTGDGVKNSKGELKNAQLRGGVMVHQDPAPGKAYGNDATGEALDLTGQGNGLMKFAVKAEEPPQASEPKTRRVADSKNRGEPSARLARVDFEGKTIESEDIIHVDQRANTAWSPGAGVFIQLADRGLLDDKGVEGDKARGAAKQPTGTTPQDKLVISWNGEMQFHGMSADLEGRPAAKIEFRGVSKLVRTPDGKREFRRGVEAKMTDSAIYTDTMDVYMDRTISFQKDTRKPAVASDGQAPPDPQIAMLECKGKDIVENALVKYPGVDIISQKPFPDGKEIKEKQRIQGRHVIYDKRTGNFYAPSPGLVYLYRRKGDDKDDAIVPTMRTVASPSNGRSRPEVILKDKKLPPLELTKIKFADGMKGRFGVAKDKESDNERRDAEFYGSVQAANAVVSSKNSDIDFDHLERWRDASFLTSDVLDVFSYPMPVGSKATNRQLLNARGNALARMNSDVIQADRITFNSASGLAYAYGDDGKEVSVTRQGSPGQRPDTSRGRTALYNKETRESRMDDPHALSFTDLKSGIRSRAFFPDLGGTPKPLDPAKLPRPPLQRQGRQSTERSGFTGH